MEVKVLIWCVAIIFILGLTMNLIVKPLEDSGVSIPEDPMIETESLKALLAGDFAKIKVTSNKTVELSGVEFIFFWFTGQLAHVIDYVTFGLSTSTTDAIFDQLNLFNYLPSWLALPIVTLLIVSITLALYVLGTMLIP